MSDCLIWEGRKDKDGYGDHRSGEEEIMYDDEPHCNGMCKKRVITLGYRGEGPNVLSCDPDCKCPDCLATCPLVGCQWRKNLGELTHSG